MKQQLLLACFIIVYYLGFSQSFVAEKIPDSTTLEIVGSLRVDSLQQLVSSSKFVVVDSATGKLGILSRDSLKSQLGVSQAGESGASIVSLVSGDTISAGNAVVIGDGVTGILTDSFNFHNQYDSSIPRFITRSKWLGQTFVTKPATVAIKSVFLSIFYPQIQSGTANVAVSIRSVSNGLPVGLDLNNQFVIDSDWVFPTNGFVDLFIIFDPPIAVSGNHSYAIIVRSRSLDSLSFRVSQNNNPTSHLIMSNDSGATWSSQGPFRWSFKLFESQSKSGLVYRSNASFFGTACIGWNATHSCIGNVYQAPCCEMGSCDLLNNIIGIATTNALPGQLVPVQVNGITRLVSGFAAGSMLYPSTIPGQLTKNPITNQKSIGIYTGNGFVIRP